MCVCPYYVCRYTRVHTRAKIHICVLQVVYIPPRQGGHALAADSFAEMVLGSVREAVGQRARRGAVLVAAHELALEFLAGRKRVYAAARGLALFVLADIDGAVRVQVLAEVVLLVILVATLVFCLSFVLVVAPRILRSPRQQAVSATTGP